LPVPALRRALPLIVYAMLAALLLGTLLEVWSDVLPESVASRINRNSEGFLAALLLALWIQFVRPRLRTEAYRWPVTVAAAGASAAVAFLLLASDLEPRFRTLNETYFAVALLLPYIQLRRPLRSRWLPAALSGGLLLVTVAANRTGIVTELAESIGLWLLLPVGLDLVDRGILDRTAQTSRPLRVAWYAALVAVPVLFSALSPYVPDDGQADVSAEVEAGYTLVEEFLRYGSRITEAFVCMLVLHLYFAVGLGRTGQDSPTDH
jgi:hypothetical protein